MKTDLSSEKKPQTQKYIYSYIDNEFQNSYYTGLKHLDGKERYLNLKHIATRKAVAKIRVSSHKLFILSSKWYTKGNATNL